MRVCKRVLASTRYSSKEFREYPPLNRTPRLKLALVHVDRDMVHAQHDLIEEQHISRRASVARSHLCHCAMGAAPRARGGLVALGAWLALVCIMGVLLTALVGGRTATELANKANTVHRALAPHMAPLSPAFFPRGAAPASVAHTCPAPPLPRE